MVPAPFPSDPPLRTSHVALHTGRMGFYYGPSKQPDEEKEPGGCMEALILTRAAFGALAIPIAVLIGAILGIVLLFVAFSIHWLAGLLYIGLIVAGVAVYARWERKKFPGETRM